MKAALNQLQKDAKELRKPKPKKPETLTIEDVNPTRGERGDFLRVTVTMPPDLLAALRTQGIMLRARGRKDTGVSELIREAVVNWLSNQED